MDKNSFVCVFGCTVSLGREFQLKCLMNGRSSAVDLAFQLKCHSSVLRRRGHTFVLTGAMNTFSEGCSLNAVHSPFQPAPQGSGQLKQTAELHSSPLNSAMGIDAFVTGRGLRARFTGYCLGVKMVFNKKKGSVSR